MPLTLHTQNTMADTTNDLYLFGEDFEAILDILVVVSSTNYAAIASTVDALKELSDGIWSYFITF